MRKLLPILLLVAVSVLLIGEDDKAKPPALREKPASWTPEAGFEIKQVASVHVSPDGKRVVYVVREASTEGAKSEYVSQIHLANADGSDPIQLTFHEKSSGSPQWSPDGNWLAFLSGRSGKNNLWLLRVRGGEAEQLTDAKSDVGAFKWSPDGKSIAFTAPDPRTSEEEKADKEKTDARVVDENIKLNRLFVVPVAKNLSGKREARQLTKANYNVSEAGVGGFDWSPDNSTIAFTHTRSPKADDWPSADISLVEVANGKIKPLASTAAAEFSPLYAPDGRSIAFIASDNPPTWAFDQRVFVVDARGGTPRPLEETFDRQPGSFGGSGLIGWSADGTKIYYGEPYGTTTRICALPLHGAPQEISKGDGVITAVDLNPSRSMFGFTYQTLTKPAEAYVSPAESFTPVAVSQANKDLPNRPLGRTEVIRWKSDDLEIEGLLTYPVGYDKQKRYPLLLVIHGGPTGVFSQSFIALPSPYPVATFATHGYAVLRCNPRGSSGYGKSFRYANYQDWGGKDFQDLMAGVDHVIQMGVADPERLGVMGWSYGGFMTSWTITQTKRFRAASVGAGVTNIMSFNGTSDIPGFVPDYFGGESWDKLDLYRAHSALFQVKGVNTPTLIQHGENDVRVPISQGYELYNALKRQGCTVKMVVYPRQPHGIREPKLLLDASNRNLHWFDKYVGAKEP